MEQCMDESSCEGNPLGGLPSHAPPRRWRGLNRARILADCLAANLEPDGYAQVLSFAAAHPTTYMGLVLTTEASCRSGTDLTQRFPCVDWTDGSGDTGRRREVVSQVSVEENGVKLNESHHREPEAAATVHLQLVGTLCASASLPHAVKIVCLHTASAARLLSSWERLSGSLAFTISSLHIRGGAVLAECVRANGGLPLHKVLGSAETLLVTASPRTADNAALKGLETLVDLRTLTAVDVPLQSLTHVSRLSSLQQVSLSEADILDTDVQALSMLPCLEKVSLVDCSRITSLDPLGSAPALTSVEAEFCEGLFRVAGLAKAVRLRRLSLVSNPFLKERELSGLLAALRYVEDLSLVGQYLPSADPPTPAVDWLAPALRRLNLNDSCIRGGAAAWFARMPRLEQLRLSRTTVTETDLHTMFACVLGDGTRMPSQVEVLTLDSCARLHTSLEFAKALPSLAKLSISKTSVAAVNCVDELRARGKDIDVM